ncbi:hypothetical protein NON08_04125 [Cetobacterium somerae]|uniref:hypothetical protein n=1 Tax=Cetobacterium sp. NK01 TaxID=2993530 RepID=UPI0021171F58|nr:hypothetical protein [Cetobacterium sp. NK01]MCQ8211741.1 hypothetical protein [Cetobacterium sp. NK01]
MKIAIVGYPDSVKKILRTLESQYSQIIFLSYEIKQLGDSLESLMELKGKVDGIFSTGVGVHSELVSKLGLEVPMVYSNREAGSILKALWEVREDYESLFSLKIGFDIVEKKVLFDTLDEFGIRLRGVDVQEYQEDKTELDFLDEHIKNLSKGNVHCVLTAFGYVYDYFKSKNKPVYRLQSTKNEITNQMKVLLKDIKINENSKNRIGIKIIKVVKKIKKDESDYDKISFKMKLNQIFLKYSKEIHGNYQELTENEYIFFTTQKILETKDSELNFLKLLNEIYILGGKVAIGIGYAENIQDATANAKKALNISILNDKGEAYLFSDNKIRGPLYKKNRFDYSTKISNTFEKEAKKIGITPKYLSKIRALQESLSKREFTSKELSELLDITERSVNRIVKPIIGNGYAEIIEYEVCSSAGRPRRVIKFKF